MTKTAYSADSENGSGFVQLPNPYNKSIETKFFQLKEIPPFISGTKSNNVSCRQSLANFHRLLAH